MYGSFCITKKLLKRRLKASIRFHKEIVIEPSMSSPPSFTPKTNIPKQSNVYQLDVYYHCLHSLPR